MCDDPPDHGWFISFEGPEGSGKSTQIGLLAHALTSAGLAVRRLREPGGTPVGEEIRELLKHAPAGEGMCAECELFLFAASRAELVRKVVAPWVASPGHAMLADRFLDSTTVYQGVARGLGLTTVRSVNLLATGGLLPHATILLDLPLAESRGRSGARNQGPDRFEREGDAFHAKVRQGYLDLAAAEPHRFIVVDGHPSPEIIHATILAELRHRLHGLLP